MTKSKKRLTSTEDLDEGTLSNKQEKDFKDSNNENLTESKKIKRKSINYSIDELLPLKKKAKIDDDLSYTEEESVKEDESNQKKVADFVSEGEKGDKSWKAEKFKLTGKSLRSDFQLKNAFDIVRRFVTVCNENKSYDLAAEYLREGGNISEILKTFNSVDQNNINNTTTLFSAVYILIEKILGMYPEGTEEYSNAEEACRRLIYSYTPAIQLMLSNQSHAKQRKVTLKMLTAMISIGGTIPLDILSNISLSPQVLEAVVRLTKPSDPSNVRTSFIHFILAFLVDGRNNVIRSILEKRDVLSSIFPDLIYDSHDTVNLTLTSVKKFVLENRSVSKTTKLHIFSTPVVQSLVNLYNWKGPRNWEGLKKEKVKTKVEKVDPEKKEIAVEAVHEFLLTLLTSKKHGIIFQSKSLGSGQDKTNNQLVNTILRSLERPWEYDKPRDLVVQILKVCPDFIKFQITQTEPLLIPKVSIKWIKLMKFLNQIISSLDLKRCFQDAIDLSESRAEKFATTVINLTLPTTVLKKAVAPALLHNNLVIRHESILLFTTMLNQTKKLLLLAEDSFDCEEFKTFNNYLIENMADNAPIFERCLRTWKNTLEPIESEMKGEKEGIECPSMEDVLESILNLLKAFHNAFPTLVYVNVESDINCRMLLSGLYNQLDIPENVQSDLNISAIDFLLTINPFMFTPEQEFYGQALLFLLMALDEQAPTLDKVKSSIAKLVEVPRAFYKCEDQITIWFNAFLHLKDFDERLEVSQWFVKIVGRIFKRVEKYHSAIKAAEESCDIGIEKYMRFFEDLKTSEAYCKGSNDNLQSVTSIPLVLCSALDSLRKKSSYTLIRFMNEVLTHTLYYQVKPNPLLHLTKDIKDLKLQI